MSTSTLDVGPHQLLCLTFADLTQQNAQKLEIERLGRAQAERMLELEEAQTALTEQATHDALTGLPNRNLLLDRLSQALTLAERTKTSIGLIFIDLDHFKTINDTLGHAAGDAVLRKVAERLLNAVRTIDSVSRLGGDEFVVLLPVLESSLNAMNVAERIAAAMDPPIELEHGAVPVTASIGVSVADHMVLKNDPDPERLLERADSAMYRAKSLGGSQIKLFGPGCVPSALEAGQGTWVARIREALDEDRFVLHAQPVVQLATRTVVQHELLLRLRDRDGHLIAPVAFLPTAERCGLMSEIDRWVIQQAMTIAARGQPVAVNLSPTSVGDPAMLEFIEHELQRSGTDPANLVLEITEITVMLNIDRGRLFAERLVALGCCFTLDDFGTGFATFTYLKHLPVQYLKIDIEFVRDLARSQGDRSVVSAIVALAAGFGQRTIAEGVEDERTARMLRDLGVDFGQGYLFGRPAPAHVDEAIAAAASP